MFKKKQDIRKAVLDAQDIPEELVPLPDKWGGDTVLIRGLDAGEIADWATSFSGKPSKMQNAELILICVRDPETREPLFDKADRDELLRKGAGPFGEVLAHCHRLSGLISDKRGDQDLKAVTADGVSN